MAATGEQLASIQLPVNSGRVCMLSECYCYESCMTMISLKNYVNILLWVYIYSAFVAVGGGLGNCKFSEYTHTL